MALVKSFFYIATDFISIYVTFVIFSSCLVYSNSASEIKRPRGVSISKASLYIPDKDFTCFDGSYSVPFSQVNDDYCDCEDGSDEPGTSACSNSFFHCTNAGFKPLNIPSSQVNDGVCDCCDGTDEYLGKIDCLNTCYELGKAERMEAQKQAEIIKKGYEAKLQAIKRGKELKQEKKKKLKQLELDKQEAENIKSEKTKFKMELEELENIALGHFQEAKEAEENRLKEEEKKAAEQEALEIFNMLDSNQDKKIQLNELRYQQTFDQNKDGFVSNKELKIFFENNEEIDWETFLLSGWPKMKPFFMMEKGLFKPPENNFSVTDNEMTTESRDGVSTIEDVTNEYHQERQKAEKEIEAHEKAKEEEEEEDREGEGEGVRETETETDAEAEREQEEEEEEEEEEADLVNKEAEEKDETPEPQYDEETQKIINAAKKARSEYEEADRALRDIQRQISQYQEYLEKDFGPEEEFAPLEGECFEYSDREYVYKLCPFDMVSQQPHSAESETRLGLWNDWMGPEDDKYQAMFYDKGQACWNGPQRSTFVKLKCGIENVITSVTEPNKCEYYFEFSTPSACKTIDPEEETIHDEL